MQAIAHFYFYDALNDFLRPAKKETWLDYAFYDSPAVKDAIEAIGVPHTEVGCILINGQPVTFLHSLHPFDKVEVYPFQLKGNLTCLVQVMPIEIKFVLDVHLGALARLLRMLGFDTLYENNLTDPDIAQIAAAEKRIVLTRDINLLKHKIIETGYWLRSQMPEEQVLEVINRYQLKNLMQPFVRCIACNGILYPVDKASIIDKLPGNTPSYYNTFYQCRQCQRVYWKGAHFAQMEKTLKRIKGFLKS